MRIVSLYSYNYCSNTFLAVSNNECAIIDPGQPLEIIEKALNEYTLVPKFVLLTHGHFDHIFSLDDIRQKYSIPAYIHEEDNEMLTDSIKNAYSFFFEGNLALKSAEKTFKNEDTIKIGSEELRVIHTPGHTKGSSCFLCDNILITGDTLFANGIGRTDLYGGSSENIFRSLGSMRNIEPSDEITIYAGHGKCEVLSLALDNSIY